MTAVPNDRSLGLIRCIRKIPRQKEAAIFLPNLVKSPAVDSAAFCDARPTETPALFVATHGVTDRVVGGGAGAPVTGSIGIESVFNAAASGRCSMVAAGAGSSRLTEARTGADCGSSAALAAVDAARPERR
jgi:hypothetical protein